MFCKENDMKSSIRAAARPSPATAMVKLAAVLAFAASTLLAPQPARAGRLGNDIIALFPKEVGEFAYADLKKARTMKWFPQLQDQLLPDRFRQFEKFLASAGVDPNTQVEELAWGLVAESVTGKGEGATSSAIPTGEQIVGVALETYIPAPTEAYSSARSCPRSKRATTRSMPSVPAPAPATCSSCLSTRAPRRSDIARFWRKWLKCVSARKKACCATTSSSR